MEGVECWAWNGSIDLCRLRLMWSWEDSDRALAVLWQRTKTGRRGVHGAEFALRHLVDRCSWPLSRREHGKCATPSIGHIERDVALARVERAEVTLGVERVTIIRVVRAGSVELVVVVWLNDHATSVCTAGRSTVIIDRCPALNGVAEVVVILTISRPYTAI